MKLSIPIILSLILLTTGVGCAKKEAKPIIERTIFILVDLSESAVGARKDYLESLNKIKEKIRAGDHDVICSQSRNNDRCNRSDTWETYTH